MILSNVRSWREGFDPERYVDSEANLRYSGRCSLLLLTAGVPAFHFDVRPAAAVAAPVTAPPKPQPAAKPVPTPRQLDLNGALSQRPNRLPSNTRAPSRRPRRPALRLMTGVRSWVVQMQNLDVAGGGGSARRFDRR